MKHVRVYICVYIYIYIYVYEYTHTYTYVHIHVCVYMYIHTYTWVYAYTTLADEHATNRILCIIHTPTLSPTPTHIYVQTCVKSKENRCTNIHICI